MPAPSQGELEYLIEFLKDSPLFKANIRQKIQGLIIKFETLMA